MDRRELIVWVVFGGSLALIATLACELEEGSQAMCCTSEGCVETTECWSLGGVVAKDCESCPEFVECCLRDGCVRRTLAACEWEGGTPLEPGMNCDAEGCLQPAGACCLGEDQCSPDRTRGECEAEGSGIWLGADTDCSECLQAGACDLGDGVCFETTIHECLLGGREFRGPGTSCPEADTGSCVLGDGTCLQATFAACEILLGIDLDEDPRRFIAGARCPTGAGACETASGCEVLTAIECGNRDGAYGGDGSECPATGACCIGEDTCRHSTLARCIEDGGTYRGDGSVCGGNCQEPMTGACCFGETCVVVRREACELEGGAYGGDGVACGPGTCSEVPIGACCMFDGSCIDGPMTDDCAAFKEGVTCADDPDPCIGACCLFETGGCEMMTAEACGADPRSGVFYGPNFDCERDGPFCPPPDMGACFTADGCIRATRPQCEATPGNEYLGPGTICPPGLAGALPDGGGGGAPGASLVCARECMQPVSLFLAACDAQGLGIASCAPAASRMFRECLSGCAPGCAADCMTESSTKLALCLAFGTATATCLDAARPDFTDCLSACPADAATDCLAASATTLADCLLAGGDPIACARDANASIDACLTPEPPPGTAQLGGDCNQDGVVDVADVTCVVRILFAGFDLLDRSAPELPCATAAGDLAILDASANQAIDVADIVALAGFLFGGGAPPPGGAACRLVDAELGCPQNSGCR